MVELQCHGTDVCLNRVLRVCLEAGARLAEPGWFLTLCSFLFFLFVQGSKAYSTWQVNLALGGKGRNLLKLSLLDFHNFLVGSIFISNLLCWTPQPRSSFHLTLLFGSISSCLKSQL